MIVILIIIVKSKLKVIWSVARDTWLRKTSKVLKPPWLDTRWIPGGYPAGLSMKFFHEIHGWLLRSFKEIQGATALSHEKLPEVWIILHVGKTPVFQILKWT